MTLSEEHRRKISLALKGRKKSGETRRKMSIAQMGNKKTLGKHLPKTEEHRKKLGITHLGLHPSLETRIKMSNSHLHKPRLYLRGKHPSEETRKKMSKIRTGKKHSEKAKKKISHALMGNKSRIGQPLSKENIKKLRLGFLKMKRISKQNISKPQRELYLFLKQIFPDAVMEYPIKTADTYRFADIGIPSLKIDFEYDSAYWHAKRREDDEKRDLELAAIGWVTFRVNKQGLSILSKQPIFTVLMEKQA